MLRSYCVAHKGERYSEERKPYCVGGMVCERKTPGRVAPLLFVIKRREECWKKEAALCWEQGEGEMAELEKCLAVWLEEGMGYCVKMR